MVNPKKQGLEYRPDIRYELDKIPPFQYKEVITKPSNYVGSDVCDRKIKETETSLDFLITKAEENMSSMKGFDQYKDAAISKYYCKKPLTTTENKAVKTFVQANSGIDGDISVDIYPRLLTLKSDLTEDKDHLEQLKEVELDILDTYIDHFRNNYDIEPAQYDMNQIYDIDTKVEHYHKLAEINYQINQLEQKIKYLKQERSQAMEEDNFHKVEIIDAKIKRAEFDINKVRNRVSYLASEAYALHRKADNTDSYLQKVGFNLLASPLDRLDGTICCLIKLLLKQLKVSDDITDFEEFMHNMNIGELKRAIDALRGMLFLAHNNTVELMTQLENMLRNMLMAPVRIILRELIGALRKFESNVVNKVEVLFGNVLDGDMENPDTILDCLYFESFADFIYDEIEDFFDNIEHKIIDLYKFIYKQVDFYDEDSINIGKKDKLQNMYRLLTKLSTVLDGLNKFSLSEGLEEWIQSFLIKNGYGTMYNHKTGNFEVVNLQGCIDPFENDFAYHKFLPEQPDDLNTVNLANNKEYQQFKADYQPITYSCKIREDNIENDINQQLSMLDNKLDSIST